MDYQTVEDLLQAKGLNAPRLTPALIEAAIRAEAFYVFPDSLMTVCCLTLQNGFTVVGESAPASAANFDADIGRQVARSKARDKIWALEGYLLKQFLSTLPTYMRAAPTPPPPPV